MFSVADLDPSDDTIEVIASQFFSRKLSLHSIQIGPDPRVIFRRVIDDRCGAAFSSLLADLDGLATMTHHHRHHLPLVVDSGSTVVSLNSGDAFSHLLVTSHECSFAESSGAHSSQQQQQQQHQQQQQRQQSAGNDGDAESGFASGVTVGDDARIPSNTGSGDKIDGGSLFAYRVPAGKDAWKTMPWTRSVIATGFKVQSKLSNMVNPGAPGFCYTFFPTREGGGSSDTQKWSRPLIGLSGDCAEAAYILRPIGNSTEASSLGSVDEFVDKSTKYALMCEIKCKATVGSLAIGYDDFYSAEQHSGYAKIYVPCYELNKVLVFAMGSGEDEDIDDGW